MNNIDKQIERLKQKKAELARKARANKSQVEKDQKVFVDSAAKVEAKCNYITNGISKGIGTLAGHIGVGTSHASESVASSLKTIKGSTKNLTQRISKKVKAFKNA